MLDVSNLAGFFSAGIILLGALIYYFGMVIGSTKVEEYDKTGFYREGLFFIISYLSIPFVIITLIDGFLIQHSGLLTNYILNFNKHFILLILIQLCILFCLYFNIAAHTYLNRLGLLERTKHKFAEGFDNREEAFKKYGVEANKSLQVLLHKDRVELFELLFYTIPIQILGSKILLMTFSISSLYITYSISKIGTSLQAIVMSLVLTFFILTYIATSVGFKDAYYPPARIKLIDGEIIEGKVLKFGKFVHLITHDKKYFVNSIQISYVEESLFKETLHHSNILNNSKSAIHTNPSEDDHLLQIQPSKNITDEKDRRHEAKIHKNADND